MPHSLTNQTEILNPTAASNDQPAKAMNQSLAGGLPTATAFDLLPNQLILFLSNLIADGNISPTLTSTSLIYIFNLFISTYLELKTNFTEGTPQIVL